MNNDKLHNAIAALVDAANSNTGRELTLQLREALNALASLTSPGREEMLPCLASALPHVSSPSGAGYIAVWLGANVEHGADPQPQTQHLLDCFWRFARLLGTEREETEHDDELVIGLELLGQGLVAHLSHDDQHLQAIRVNNDFVEELERLETRTAGAMWLLELIRKVSGTLVVLHGEHLVGARLAYRNISNCFHLFTLLQAALANVMPDSRKVSLEVLAVARGEKSEPCQDEAWWHYGQPVGAPPDIMTTIFGEQNPAGIHTVDGQQVILLWSPILARRSWDAGFFGPVLQASPAEVRLIAILPPEEVKSWRARIGLPQHLDISL